MEYQAQRDAWYAVLKAKGFHDIERPDGTLEEHSDRYELNDNVRHVGQVFELISVDVFNAALHRYNFQSATDRAICKCLADAMTFKDIKTSLGVGQPRIERVRRQVKAWHDVGFNLLSDVE
jgi:hypothetical protein